jgi:hypothetical protein
MLKLSLLRIKIYQSYENTKSKTEIAAFHAGDVMHEFIGSSRER